jgi:hypothetical protein
MSEVKVNKISPRTACGTTTLGDSGDTFTIPSGATITNSGTATGFGRTGTVDWVTTVKVTGDSPITAVTGEGYFLDTTAGTITVNLPAGAAGSIVSMADYAATWQTNNVTVAANGSEKIGGIAEDATLRTEGQSVTFVYIDGTQGWVNVIDSTSNVRGNPYIAATGGTPCAGVTSGDYKIHTFTGPGTFCVSKISPEAADNIVGYMVVAGGGSGGTGCAGGGGGAGGYREGRNVPIDNFTASPLVADYPGPNSNEIPVAATGYPIVIGAGGAAHCGGPGAPFVNQGNTGNASSFSTITGAGGGGGGSGNTNQPSPGDNTGVDGGSGGGGGHNAGAGGSGDTPSVTPAQGTDGSASAGSVGPAPSDAGGAGGGATVAGTAGPVGHQGGAGATTCISGSPTAYAGGGGGANRGGGSAPDVAGGTGGGGRGSFGPRPGPAPEGSGQDGTDNTGGGGGAGKSYHPAGCLGASGKGGSGIVIIRYKFQ